MSLWDFRFRGVFSWKLRILLKTVYPSVCNIYCNGHRFSTNSTNSTIPQNLQIPQIPELSQTFRSIAKTSETVVVFADGCEIQWRARHSQHSTQRQKSLFVLKTINFPTNSTNSTIPQILQIPQIPQIMEFNI